MTRSEASGASAAWWILRGGRFGFLLVRSFEFALTADEGSRSGGLELQRAAISAHSAQSGSSTSRAIASAITSARPEDDVVTSNHASTRSSAAVTAATGETRGSRRSQSKPLPSRANPSITPSPTQALDQPETRVVSGSELLSR